MTVTETVRRGFVTGLILVAPLAVTVVVVQIVYGWLIGFVQPFLQFGPVDTTPFVEPLALLSLFVFITVLGIVVRNGIGNEAVVRFDRLMEVIPGVSPIYSSARQASTAIASHEDQFERVALVRWPSADVRTIGFVTAETPETVSREFAGTDSADTHYNVFVPMAPNPMGGFFAVVPESELTMTDLSVSEGFQILVTTGMSGDKRFDAEALSQSPS